MRILTFSIDLSDLSLDSLSRELQETVNQNLQRIQSQLLGPGERIADFDLHPVRADYSLPDLDSHHRDFHYTDRGFLLVVKIVSEPFRLHASAG